MSAFVLFAHLRTPMAVCKPIHLDGLLLAARERAEDKLDMERPLECVAMDRGVYRASAGVLLCHNPLGNSPMKVVRSWRFRTETHEGLSWFRLHDGQGQPVARGERTLPLSNSPYKPHFAEREMHAAVSTVGWQFVGDPHAVLKLARSIDCLGPGSNQGFGRVQDWTMEVVDVDPEGAGWYTGDRVLRNLPFDLAPERLRRGGSGFTTGRERVAPPYWDRDGRQACLVPIPRALVAGYDVGQEMLGLAA